MSFPIEGKKTLELHDAASSTKQIAAPTDVGLRSHRNVEVERRRVEYRRRHLRRHEALPHQLVQLELIRRQMHSDFVRPALRRGGTNGFVRVLRVFLLPVTVQPNSICQEFGAKQR